MSARLPLQGAIEALRVHAEREHPALGASLSFARDLCAQFDRRGLSDKQVAWVYRLLDRCENPAPPAAPLGDVTPIVRLFERAKGAGLRFPKIRLRASDGTRVVLGMAGDRAKVPGSLSITDGGAYGMGRYFGRITRDGAFTASSSCTPAVTATLRELAEDPAGRAAIHGHASGSCCFCGRTLDDARSTAVGYGPVCAEKFGLPWGEEKAPEETFTA